MLKLPKKVGPYSFLREAGNLVFTSGQLPINPETNTVDKTDIQGQTIQVLENLKAVLATVELGLEDVIKCTVLLSNMDDFQVVNEIYGTYFNEPYPSRTAYQVAKLPLAVKIEIEAIASKRA
ncbi:MAG: Rid family detoxifying hydrolase [Acholeplasmataceae bacterium]